jgi:hypothetical protein
MQDAEHVAAAARHAKRRGVSGGAKHKKPAAVATGSYGIPAFVFPKLAANYEKSMNAARAGEKITARPVERLFVPGDETPADRFTSAAV